MLEWMLSSSTDGNENRFYWINMVMYVYTIFALSFTIRIHSNIKEKKSGEVRWGVDRRKIEFIKYRNV